LQLDPGMTKTKLPSLPPRTLAAVLGGPTRDKAEGDKPNPNPNPK